MEELTDSWKLFIEQYPQFIKLQRELAKRDWYVKDGWAMFIGPYFAGIYAQVYKTNWFNYTLDGVHIETGMTSDSVETKKLQIDLHIGHRNLFDREKFNDLTIPQIEAIIDRWDVPKKFSKQNLSDRLSIWVPFTKSAFAKKVAAGFDLMCSLGDVIDDGIAGLS